MHWLGTGGPTFWAGGHGPSIAASASCMAKTHLGTQIARVFTIGAVQRIPRVDALVYTHASGLFAPHKTVVCVAHFGAVHASSLL